MKSDIEIARSIELKKIKQVAENVGIPREEVENYGRYIAKIPTNLIDEEKVKKSNLILVTAITATKAGIGRTLFRHEGGGSRWRLCPSASYGKDKSALYRRFSCHHFGAQYDIRIARQLSLSASGGWIRAERDYLAACIGCERPFFA